MHRKRFSDMGKCCLLVIIVRSVFSSSASYPQMRQKIVGGVDADDAEYPFLVGISYVNSFCSGSIISRKYILTAAHCVNEIKPEGIPNVHIRTGNIKSRTGGQVYDAERIAYHSEFEDSGSYPHDIAIIKVKSPIKFNQYTQPISLTDSIPRMSHKVTVIGWGRISPGNSVRPSKPQEADLVVISRKRCAKAHQPDPINRNHICVMGSRRVGICYGDSGGPLLYNNALVGITSWSGPSCARGLPDVFTSIPYHLEWIDNAIRKLNKPRSI